MRRGVVGVGVMMSVLGGFAACGGFEAEPPANTPDGGADTGGGALDANGTETEDTGSPLDAGLCARCRSGQCYEDAGCFPLAFITVGKYPGNFGTPDGGLARGDQLCNDDGNTGMARKSEFRAWLSTGTENAITRLTAGHAGGATRPVVLPSGAVVVASYNEMIRAGGSGPAPIHLAANGALIPNQDQAWTGTAPNGGNTLHTCENWTQASGSAVGTFGLVNTTAVGNWTEATSATCEGNRHLYCFELVP